MNGEHMRLIPLLILSTFCAAAGAKPPQADQAALVLAIKSQNTLNDLATAAGDPQAMRDAKKLKETKAALDARFLQWPNVASGPDPWDDYRLCKNALEKASYVAELSNMKATSSLDDKVFSQEKGKLARLRADCGKVIKSGGKAA